MSTAIIIISAIVAIASLTVSLIVSAQAKKQLEKTGMNVVGRIDVTMQNEGVIVPVLYGRMIICGNLIWYNAQLLSPSEYEIAFWEVFTMGDIYLLGLTMFVDRAVPGTPVSSIPGFFGFNDVDRTAPINNGFTEVPMSKTRLPGVSHWFRGYESLGVGIVRLPTYSICALRDLCFIPLPYTNVGNLNTADASYGSNPAAVIYDLLTNKQYGLSKNPSCINLSNFTEASNYFYINHYGINFVLVSSENASSIIKRIQDTIGCFLAKDDNDKYCIKIVSENDLPVCTIDIDNEKITFSLSRKSWLETTNSLVLNYTEHYRRTTGGICQAYGQNTIKSIGIKDNDNINITGEERKKEIDLTMFVSVDNDINHILKRGREILRQENFPFANVQLTADLNFAFLRLSDVVTLYSSVYNLNRNFRIISIEAGKIDTNQITYNLIEMDNTINYPTFEYGVTVSS